MKFVSALFAFLLLPVSSEIAGPHDWEKEITAFEQADREHPPEKGAILFIGSSTIRRWNMLAHDFPGFRVINRGFGGSQMEDAARFAHRILAAHEPAVVVLFAGTNDINAGKPPVRVFEDFKAFAATVRERFSGTKICFMEITSSPSRWAQHDKVVEANRMIRAYCEATAGVKFIAVREMLLGANGEPREDLFVSDRLHLNADGYRIVADAIRPFLPKQ